MSKNPHYVAYDSGHRDATDDARIAAFGAIRRAAEVAREYDNAYGEAYLARDWDTCGVISDGNGIRRAIRAAIGPARHDQP